jgi:hypothetical protein
MMDVAAMQSRDGPVVPVPDGEHPQPPGSRATALKLPRASRRPRPCAYARDRSLPPAVRCNWSRWKEFPGRSPFFGRGLTRFCSLPFGSGRSGPLTLDVAKMYRDNIAPDPGSLLRRYGGSSAGAGVFYVLAGSP